MQKGLGNHHIFCAAKSKLTNREGIKQLMDDIEEELRPLEMYTANYFKMNDGQDLKALYTPMNQILNVELPSTYGLEILRNNIKHCRKDKKDPCDEDYEEGDYIFQDDYLDTSELNKYNVTSETSKTTVEDEVTETDIEDFEINDYLSTLIKKKYTLKMIDEEIEEDVEIKKKSTQKMTDEEIEDDVKITKKSTQKIADEEIEEDVKIKKKSTQKMNDEEIEEDVKIKKKSTRKMTDEEIEDDIKIKKKCTQKMTDEEIEEDIKIYDEAAVFRRRLQEIKIKQSSVRNLEQMAKITLRRVAKIRAIARYRLRKLEKARKVYLRKLKALLKKMHREYFY